MRSGLPTSADIVLADTSAAIALVAPDNPHHQAALAELRDSPRGLSGHAYVEFLSVLTRLPPPRRLSGSAALRLVRATFPESRFLSATETPGVVARLVAGGIVGGALYDGLVGAAAKEHALTLVSCDVRAARAYDALGVDYVLAR